MQQVKGGTKPIYSAGTFIVSNEEKRNLLIININIEMLLSFLVVLFLFVFMHYLPLWPTNDTGSAIRQTGGEKPAKSS